MLTHVSQVLRNAHERGVDRLDAQVLLLHAMGRSTRDRAWLIAHDTDALPAAVRVEFERCLQRRENAEPVAYITGHKEFFGLDLHVDERVLVPRPDTETLVSWALEKLDGPIAALFSPPFSVLDLGTGSGAIALALKHTRPDVIVDAVDLSADALAVARANARALALELRFIHGRWTEQVDRAYHCIVSNPPYVAEGDPHLALLKNEPALALVSGPDGLRDIRHLVFAARDWLRPGAWLLLEHGHDQAGAVHTLFSNAGYDCIESRSDLAGIARCTGGQHRGARPGAGKA